MTDQPELKGDASEAATEDQTTCLLLRELVEARIIETILAGHSVKVEGPGYVLDGDGVSIGQDTEVQGNSLCSLIRGEPSLREACMACDKYHIQAVFEEGVSKSYVCHAGMVDYAAPIKVREPSGAERVIAVLFSGQQVAKPERSELLKRCRHLSMGLSLEKAEALNKLAAALPESSADQIDQRKQYADTLARSLSELASAVYTRIWRSEMLEAAARERRWLVEDVYHELLQPLQSLLTVAEAMQRTAAPGKLQDYAGRIKAEVLALSIVMRNLLLVAEGGQVREEPHIAAADLRQLVAECVDRMRPYAIAGGLDVDIFTEDTGSSLVVRTDSSFLTTVLLNLLDNAIKYSAHGSSIGVRLARTPNRQTISIEITNVGIGIPASDLGPIFERGYRCHAARKVAVTGAGIGLYVCRAVVQSLGGNISATSVPCLETPGHCRVAFQLTLPGAVEEARDA